jgi:hypothetical protein
VDGVDGLRGVDGKLPLTRSGAVSEKSGLAPGRVGWQEGETMADDRQITHVCLTESEAEERLDWLRQQGRHPRVHQRTASAECHNMTIWVVVADTYGAHAKQA